MQTLTPGVLGATNAQAAMLAQAAECVPLRVVVQAQGGAGALLFISYDSGSLNAVQNNFASSGFQLAMGEREVFYVAGGQSLSAIASVSGVSVCVAVSEAVDMLGDIG